MKKSEIDKLFFSKTGDFLDRYLNKQCSRSKHTVKGYRDALTVFRRYVTDVKSLSLKTFTFSDCTRDFVLGFMEYLLAEGKAKSTCNQRLAAIKSYLSYVADGDISVQQTSLAVSRIPFLKQAETVHETLSSECLAALLAAPAGTKIGIRDMTIMVLLYDTGIRLDELLGIRMTDIMLDRKSPHIFIHGKGDKERIVTLSERAEKHVRRYIKLYHGESAPSTEHLIYTVIKGHTGKMSPGNVERIIKKYADQVRIQHPELPKSVFPHLLRGTRATDLYQSGVEIELISRLLGHASTQTTRKHYAKASLEMFREAMEKSPGTSFDEKPLWPDNEAELAKLFGLR